MNTPGAIYDQLRGGHATLIYEGAGSVLCSLSDGTSAIGEGAMLPTDDPSYDASDVLRGLPSFTGASYDSDTGLMVSADQAEIGVLQSSVTLGRPEAGWMCTMRNFDGTDVTYRIFDVLQDRTLGAYRLKLEISKATGTGRRIERAGEGGV